MTNLNSQTKMTKSIIQKMTFKYEVKIFHLVPSNGLIFCFIIKINDIQLRSG